MINVFLNNSLLYVPTGGNSLIIPVYLNAAPPVGKKVLLPQTQVIDEGCIKSIESITSTGTELSIINYFNSQAVNVIRENDLIKFSLTLKIDDNIQPVQQLPLGSINSDKRKGKKLAFMLKNINTRKSFIQRHDSGAFTTLFPCVVPLIFYY